MKKKTLFYSLLLITLAGSLAMAETEAGHHGLDSHTKTIIIYQLINVVLLVGLLAWAAKKMKVSAIFEQKKQQFVDRFEKIQADKKAAEHHNQEIRHHLERLSENSQETIIRARAEAADLKEKIVSEAQALAQRIRDEARTSSELEIIKAKQVLRNEMIRQATRLAQEQLQGKVSADDHKRLQGEFITNIKTVQS